MDFLSGNGRQQGEKEVGRGKISRKGKKKKRGRGKRSREVKKK